MTQFVGPDGADRFTRTEPGRWVTVYTDQACTTPAVINVYDPLNPSTPGAAIANSRVSVDVNKMIPLFWYPDGVRVLWGKFSRGETAVFRLAADYDAQFTAGGGGGGGGSGLATTGGTLTGPLTMQSTAVGGLDTSDTTSRLMIESYQTNGNNFFGEGIRLDLKKFYSKNMIAWRLPRPVDRFVDKENFIQNLSFETDTSNWSTIGSAAVAISATHTLIGAESGKITWATGAALGQGISQTVTGLTVGHTYTFDGWVYVPTGMPAVTFAQDADGTTATSTQNDVYQELTVTFVATATSHTVRIINAGTATSGQNAWVDAIQVLPALTDPISVVWAGAHYEAQDLSAIHGHWSVEVPNALDHLTTRFEIKFADQNGQIGLDRTLVQTSAADLVADCSNGQMLRLRTGAGAVKAIDFNNDQWGSQSRWQVRQNGTAESGSNVGSDFEIGRFNDAGTTNGVPLLITRSSGRVTFGGTDGSQSGITINRNSSGQAITVNNTGTGGTCLAHVANTADAATGRTMQSSVLGESGTRFVQYADGKHEWGDGTNPRDAVLYRSAAGVLKTDTAMHVGGDFRHLGSNVGFYNATAVTKPTVSGAKGSNAALASLMTALVALGLVTDSTSA